MHPLRGVGVLDLRGVAPLQALPLTSQSSDRVTAQTPPKVNEDVRDQQATHSVEQCNYLTTEGGRTHLRVMFSSASSTTPRAHAKNRKDHGRLKVTTNSRRMAVGELMFLAFSSTQQSNTTATTLLQMQQVILTLHGSNLTRGRQNRRHTSYQQATTQPTAGSSQDTLQTVNWRFCNMNMTASSTQHPATFELGCHVCGLQETRLIAAGAATS